jgi:hypothetical protein
MKRFVVLVQFVRSVYSRTPVLRIYTYVHVDYIILGGRKERKKIILSADPLSPGGVSVNLGRGGGAGPHSPVAVRAGWTGGHANLYTDAIG